MTKRVCQSCRFFQAAGRDSMGWCTHPKRRTGDDVRIYVRANELPCRNDWSIDLWQAAAHDSTDRLIYNDKTGVLTYDSDGSGSGAAIEIATLSNKGKLASTDFWVF